MRHDVIGATNFAQAGFRCTLEWGWRGAQSGAARGDILVIVDVLRFSTTAVTAVHHGVKLFPCRWDEDINAFARRVNAIPGGHRAGENSQFTLSPLCYLDVPFGTRIALASPNGATCARYAGSVPHLFVGAFLNAEAVARQVLALMEESDFAVTVVACGERWSTPSEDGNLRFAVEDYLGAGAILTYLDQNLSEQQRCGHNPIDHKLVDSLSPEAAVCAGAFRSVQSGTEGRDLTSLLLTCGSGRELQGRGLATDVHHAAKLNLYNTVPSMRGECLVAD